MAKVTKLEKWLVAIIFIVNGIAIGLMFYDVITSLKPITGSYVWVIVGFIAVLGVLLTRLTGYLLRNTRIKPELPKYVLYPIISLVVFMILLLLLLLVSKMFNMVGVIGVVFIIVGVITAGFLFLKLTAWLIKQNSICDMEDKR